VLKHPKESFHNNFVSLDCDQCTMVTQHGKPMFTQVPCSPSQFLPARRPSSPGSVPFAQRSPGPCGLMGLACAESHGRQGQATGKVFQCTGRVSQSAAVGSQGVRAEGRGGLRLTLRPAQVCVEGRLYLEFMFDDMMRIKTWHFSIRQHRELIPRSILAMHVSTAPGAPRGTSDPGLLSSFPCCAAWGDLDPVPPSWGTGGTVPSPDGAEPSVPLAPRHRTPRCWTSYPRTSPAVGSQTPHSTTSE